MNAGRRPSASPLVADLFSAMMVAITGSWPGGGGVFPGNDRSPSAKRFGYYPLAAYPAHGRVRRVSHRRLFNLYVWFEVMLMASFVLTGARGRASTMEGAIKYVTINLSRPPFFSSPSGCSMASSER